jgi:hypothetical protein
MDNLDLEFRQFQGFAEVGKNRSTTVFPCFQLLGPNIAVHRFFCPLIAPREWSRQIAENGKNLEF